MTENNNNLPCIASYSYQSSGGAKKNMNPEPGSQASKTRWGHLRRTLDATLPCIVTNTSPPLGGGTKRMTGNL